MRTRTRIGAALVAAGLAASGGTAGAATATGPSTTTAPYLLPVAAGVDITSLATVGDAGAAGNGYEMVGIPDGMGAIERGNDVTVYMNHELRDTAGIPRAHGQRGAFVSTWQLDTITNELAGGADLVDPGVAFYDYPTGSYVTSGARYADGTPQSAAFSRFCSGTLAPPRLFHDGNLGYKGAIWFGNEENGDRGRVFGSLEDGTTKALPRLGLGSWENTVPAANRSSTTFVLGTEDGPGDASQVWAYVGTKARRKHADGFDAAGLTNGALHVLDAVDQAVTDDAQWRSTYPAGTPGRVTLAGVDWNQSGPALNAQAKAVGLSLNRVEDGHWDPRHPNDFYFLTTEGGQKEGTGLDSRDGGGLWLLRMDDIERPELGGTLTLLLDGSEELAPGEPKMNKPDNIVVDRGGNVLIQEDPGRVNHLARVVAYRIADGATAVVARFDPALFGPGADADPSMLTIDEESSGIIEVDRGVYLFDAQVHTAKGLPAGTGPGTVQEYVEHGQLLRLDVHDWRAVYGG